MDFCKDSREKEEQRGGEKQKNPRKERCADEKQENPRKERCADEKQENPLKEQRGDEKQEAPRKEQNGEKQANPHKEHRDRMRRRFFQTGLDSFAEHEALELLLFFSIPRIDTNELAHSLISRFGSLSGVLSASWQELAQVRGVGERSAALLTLVPQILQKARLLETELILDSSDSIGLYLLRRFENAKNERVHLLCLDRKNRLLSCPCVREGGLCGADVDVREIMKHAILSSAASVVLAHNHPSGIPFPSPSDYAATDRVREALSVVGIRLLDHVIVANRDYVSLRDCGYL